MLDPEVFLDDTKLTLIVPSTVTTVVKKHVWVNFQLPKQTRSTRKVLHDGNGKPIAVYPSDKLPVSVYIGDAHHRTVYLSYFRSTNHGGPSISFKVDFPNGHFTEEMLERAKLRYDICPVSGDYIYPRVEIPATSEDLEYLESLARPESYDQ